MASELPESPVVFTLKVTAIAKVATLYEVRAPTLEVATKFLRAGVDVAEAAWTIVEVDPVVLEFEGVGEAYAGVSVWEPGKQA